MALQFGQEAIRASFPQEVERSANPSRSQHDLADVAVRPSRLRAKGWYAHVPTDPRAGNDSRRAALRKREANECTTNCEKSGAG